MSERTPEDELARVERDHRISELRDAAKSLRELFVAYVEEGFTPGEALTLISAILTASLGSSE